MTAHRSLLRLLPLFFLSWLLLWQSTIHIKSDTTQSHSVGKEHYTVIDKTASIAATKGGIKLDAAKNIENIGANLTSAGGIALVAGEDVNIKTIKDERSYDYKFNNGYAKGNSVKHIQSNIKAGGLLDVKAGHDVNFEVSCPTVQMESLSKK